MLVDDVATHVALRGDGFFALADGTYTRDGSFHLDAEGTLVSRDGVPVLGEVLPGFEYSVWQGLVAPFGTPASVASRISGAVADIVRQPDVAKRLADVGLEAVGSSPAEMGAMMRQDRERWGKVVKETGARAD